MLAKLICTIWILIATLKCIPCAADIYVVASAALPLNQLSEQQVRKLFLGRLPLLPETQVEPEVFDLPAKHPLYEPFYSHISGMTAQKLKRYRAYYLFSGKGKVPTRIESREDLIERLENTDAGVGYTDVLDGNDKIKVLYKIKTR